MSNIGPTLAQFAKEAETIDHPSKVNEWYSKVHKFLLEHVGEGAVEQFRLQFYTAKEFNVCDVRGKNLPVVMEKCRAFLLSMADDYTVKAPPPVAFDGGVILTEDPKPKRKKGN